MQICAGPITVSVTTVLCAKVPLQVAVELVEVTLVPPFPPSQGSLDGVQAGGAGQVWQGIVTGTHIGSCAPVNRPSSARAAPRLRPRAPQTRPREWRRTPSSEPVVADRRSAPASDRTAKSASAQIEIVAFATIFDASSES
jgi:hypothetical protein